MKTRQRSIIIAQEKFKLVERQLKSRFDDNESLKLEYEDQKMRIQNRLDFPSFSELKLKREILGSSKTAGDW